MYDELDLKGTFDLWKTLHRRMWAKYDGDPANEKLLLTAAGRYRKSLTGMDRAFCDVESELQRSDDHDEEWDRQQAAERQRAAEEAEARNVVLQPGFFEYAGSLSFAELQKLYYNDKSFRLQYNLLVREHGYRIPAAPRAV